MNLADLNPLKRAPKPQGSDRKTYIGADLESPHAGLSLFAEARPTGGCFVVEGFAPILKAELCGKLINWDAVPDKFLSSLKTGGSVTVPLDKFKALIK